MEITEIYVCPKGCKTPLIGEIEVTQDWIVSCCGELVSELSTDGLNEDFLSLKCKECGSAAECIICTSNPVYEQDANSHHAPKVIGKLFLPVDNQHIAYYLANDGIATEPTELHIDTGRQYILINATKYFITDDGVFPDIPLEGQETMF